MDTPFQQFSKGKGNPDADPMVWGGKGAGLARMAAQGYPVPPGFTICTDLCKMYQDEPEAVMDAIMADLGEHLDFLKAQFGYMPLLSVRSGAPVSMPGMMETILNVGMTPGLIGEWTARIGERAAWDSLRRLAQMMGTTALGIPHEHFAAALHNKKMLEKVETDAELTADHLKKLCETFGILYETNKVEMPVSLEDQLRCAIDAVFGSWMSDNAKAYRKIEGISDELGTAVTVQAMVFGNMNDNSGSGVLFTRNPSTGDNEIFAEYLVNAQGEDVVAGIRTPEVLKLHQSYYGWEGELAKLCDQLEADYKDMVDAEFTVQDGELFMLQSRAGKRSAQAAFRIAVDMHDEGTITEDEMLGRVKRKHLRTVRKPSIDPKFKKKPVLTGIGASMGIASGRVALSSQKAVEMAAQGLKVILVTHETTPDDIAGMAVSVGILTQTGGATSHAAVVARGMDKPCVVGCTALDFNALPANGTISIDGATGRVWFEAVPVLGGEMAGDVARFIDKLLAKHAVYPQYAVPTANGTVVLADWLYKTDAEIADLIGQAKVVEVKGDQMVVDITPPDEFGDEADDGIWGIAGTAPEKERFIEKVLHHVLHSGLQKAVRVTGGSNDLRQLFEMKGFEVLPQADTVAELLQHKGLVSVAPALMKVMGEGLVTTLKENGLFDGQLTSGSLPVAYAAFQLMGE